MNKKQLKAQIRDLKDMLNIERVENESLKIQIQKQKEINNIAVGENYTLNKAYKTMKKQLEAQVRDLVCYIAICETVKNAFIETLNTIEEHYNSQIETAENEIERLNVIIGYLEDKLYEEELKDDNKTRVSK